jgi:hypothetical protein
MENKNPYYRPHETAESRLLATVFLVEASSYEQQMLWERHAKQSRDKINPDDINWQQISPGWSVHVGKLDGRPVCISMNWVELNGAPVCFWYAQSQVVDHAMIDTWLDAHCKAVREGGARRGRCDVWNFHHCLQAVEEAQAALA